MTFGYSFYIDEIMVTIYRAISNHQSSIVGSKELLPIRNINSPDSKMVTIKARGKDRLPSGGWK